MKQLKFATATSGNKKLSGDEMKKIYNAIFINKGIFLIN